MERMTSNTPQNEIFSDRRFRMFANFCSNEEVCQKSESPNGKKPFLANCDLN